MANKSRFKGGKSADSWKDRLHTVDFSYEDELAVKRWLDEKKPEPYVLLEELLDNGWSVRISPPISGDDYWCTATAKSVEKSIDGHSFSVKYPDMRTSVLLCGYVILVMLPTSELDSMIEPRSREWLKT